VFTLQIPKIPVLEIFSYLKIHGIRKTLVKYRWRFCAIVFLYYLIRDTLFYILFPFGMAWWLGSG